MVQTKRKIAVSKGRPALEQRIEHLEADLRRTNEALVKLLHGLEKRFGEDLDGDNRVG